jgi:hypothetical protein
MRPPVALTGNLRRCSKSRLWNATPISVKNTSRFFPLKLSLAASRTFSSVSQQATQGSVFTRAKEISSFLGLKSAFFCLVNCKESHPTIASRGMKK